MAKAGRDLAEQGAGILKRTFREFLDDDCPRRAAALSYYTVFALPPLLVLLVIAVGLVLSPEQVQGWIQSQVGTFIGPAAARQIETMVESAHERVQGGFSLQLVLGIAGLLFGATGAFAQLQHALNAAWGVEPDPEQSGLKRLAVKRALSLGMILVTALLVLAALIISSLITALSSELGGFLPGGMSASVAWFLNTGVSLLVATLLLAAIFRVLPDATVAWRDVWIGAIATALLFMLGKVLLGLYIGHSDPTQVYGAAAALALLLVWIYYSAIILLLGAELTQVWSQHRGRGIRPVRGAVRVVAEKRRLREPGAPDPPEG